MISTESGEIRLPIHDVRCIEQVDEGFRFQTAAGQFIGVPAPTGPSSLVIIGMIDNHSATIAFDTIVSFTRNTH